MEGHAGLFRGIAEPRPRRRTLRSYPELQDIDAVHVSGAEDTDSERPRPANMSTMRCRSSGPGFPSRRSTRATRRTSVEERPPYSDPADLAPSSLAGQARQSRWAPAEATNRSNSLTPRGRPTRRGQTITGSAIGSPRRRQRPQTRLIPESVENESFGSGEISDDYSTPIADYLARHFSEDSEEYDDDYEGFADLGGTRTGRMGRANRRATSQSSIDNALFGGEPEAGALKRSREKFESIDDKDLFHTLNNKEAVAVIMYRKGFADPHANDIWPTFRDGGKVPARYYLLDQLIKVADVKPHRRATKVLKTNESSDVTTAPLSDAPVGRPVWNLPVELVESIANYLNRDDIKAMRLVNRELNHYVSQVLFKTVVVPFNTEIYGMLGQEQELDIKGKKKAKTGAPSFVWKNANGDDVYNGHGLDVFRGFGRHISRFGMSFEVTEDALANPPKKVLTERHESFWGSFYWPFVEYRRFDDVAGLETAADETPRMKNAFSELSKVKELALSVDAGLGWLNGPDRSIRARILQRQPEVFGTLKEIPNRRTHAQQELWKYIEACHASANSDLTLSTLYMLETTGPSSGIQEAMLALAEQPEMPFMEPHVISEALPHDTADLPVPASFAAPEAVDRAVSPPVPSSTGILFTSKFQPVEAGQLHSRVNPSNLTKAQKEWLMETEWAQRAFISSYMLSIIDNPQTFLHVHTLNISRLSDRYIPMLNREDFWNAMPNLGTVTLMVLPSWRTIHKDESGWVDTPKANPSGELTSIYALLKRIASCRQKIKALTIGWATGGEHAEGVHARNKLLQPAPLLDLDTVANQDAVVLQTALLQLPFVERLTLKNCWVTPLALVEFVKLHDQLNLKHLVLDSISLTGVLMPHQNAHAAAAQQANILAVGNMFGQGPGQQNNVLNQAQFLQLQIQQLQLQINQLQHLPGQNVAQVALLRIQLHHHLQLQGQMQAPGHGLGLPPVNYGHAMHVQLNQLNGAQVHGHHNAAQVQQHLAVQQVLPAPAITPPTMNAQTLLTAPPREGSWVNVIDIITPGPNLKDLGSEHSRADEERSTSLKSIDFISCGYARLPYISLDQGDIEEGLPRRRMDSFFSKRAQTLASSMLNAKWPLLGEIIQETSPEELATLYAGWNLETGWKDEAEAKAPQFDGLLPGGTGRFTGVVRAQDRVEEATAS